MVLEFDALTTGIAFLVLLGVLLGGTLMSPMQTSTVAMVSGGLIAFGVLTLLLGVKHGEYRAGQ
ncbi:MAG: hypothetical protein ABEI98_10300 [Halorhabdus sp.]